MRVDWKTLKAFVDNTKLYNFINYMDFTDNTYVWMSYQDENFNVLLDWSTVEYEDFTTNYKPKAILKRDIANDGLTAIKSTHVLSGRLLKAMFVEFKTASLENNDTTGYIRHVMYDGNGQITQLSSDAVKTAIDFCPNFVYELYGGGLQTIDPIVLNYYVSAIIAPNIPIPYGNVYLVINKKIMSPKEDIFINGIGPSEVAYNSQMPEASVFRTIISHPQGDQHVFQSEIQYYA